MDHKQIVPRSKEQQSQTSHTSERSGPKDRNRTASVVQSSTKVILHAGAKALMLDSLKRVTETNKEFFKESQRPVAALTKDLRESVRSIVRDASEVDFFETQEEAKLHLRRARVRLLIGCVCYPIASLILILMLIFKTNTFLVAIPQVLSLALFVMFVAKDVLTVIGNSRNAKRSSLVRRGNSL